MENGDERCTLAYKMLVYQIQKLLGSYIAVLGRVDAIVFTDRVKTVPRPVKPSATVLKNSA